MMDVPLGAWRDAVIKQYMYVTVSYIVLAVFAAMFIVTQYAT